MEEEDQIKLYLSLVDQLHRYNSVMWQLPTALLATNMVAIDKISHQPWLLLALAVLNGALLYAYHRAVTRQQAIIGALRETQRVFRARGGPFEMLIPNFREGGLKADHVILGVFSLLDLLLFVHALCLIKCAA